MIYDVKLHGQNYNFINEKNETIATGFFVYFFVESDDIKEVESLAISKLMQNELYVENIKPAETIKYSISIESIEKLNKNSLKNNILSEFILYKEDDIKENFS